MICQQRINHENKRFNFELIVICVNFANSIINDNFKLMRVDLNTFEEIEEDEKKLNKDCSEFSKDEIWGYIEHIDVMSLTSARVRLYNLTNYNAWCREQKITKNVIDFTNQDGDEIMSHIKSDDIYRVFTYKELKNEFNNF